MKRWVWAGLFCLAACGSPAPDAWVCYFGPEVPAKELDGFGLVILEPDHYKSVRHLRAESRVAYLSVGECGTYRSYWPRVRGKGWVGAENPNWPGDIAVDIRSAEWRDLLLKEAIPEILSKGFNGLFLDTLNEAVEAELAKESGSAGKIDALLDLIRAIRQEHPDVRIISNNGLDILDRLAPLIDVALVEDLATMYDFKTKTYGPQSPETMAWMIDRLSKFRRETGKKVLVLDYVAGPGEAPAQKSRELCAANGFSPYLAKIGLDEIYRF